MVSSLHGPFSFSAPAAWPAWAQAWLGLRAPRLLLTLFTLAFSVFCASPVFAFVVGSRLGGILPRNISPAALIALWSIEAGLYGLIAGIAGLLITIAPNQGDRGRLLRRFRRNAFDTVAAFGLAVILLTGLRIVWIEPIATASESVATASVEGVLVLFAAHVLALGWLVFYGYRLLLHSLTPEISIEWLKEEIRASLNLGLTSQVSVIVLNERLLKDDLYRVKAVARTEIKSGTEHVIRAGDLTKYREGGRYIHDIRIDRLVSWASLLDPEVDRIDLALAIGDVVKSRDVVAVISAVSEVDITSDLARTLTWRKRTAKDRFSRSLDALRDRGVRAARDGLAYEFSLVLETLNELYVSLLTSRYGPVYAAAARNAKPEEFGSLLDRLPIVLPPAVWLREAYQRIGEEALGCDSPTVITTWMAAPHDILRAARPFPLTPRHRPAVPIEWLWTRAADAVVDGWAKRPDVVVDALAARLDYYATDLSEALEGEPRVAPLLVAPIKDRIRDEAQRFVETCATVIPALEPRQPGLLCSLVEKIPIGQDSKFVFWAYYADWIVGKAASNDPGDGSESLIVQWKRSATNFATGSDLWDAFDAPVKLANSLAGQYQMLAMSPEEQAAFIRRPNPVLAKTLRTAMLTRLLMMATLQGDGKLMKDDIAIPELAGWLVTHADCERADLTQLQCLSSDIPPRAADLRVALCQALWRKYEGIVSKSFVDLKQGIAQLEALNPRIAFFGGSGDRTTPESGSPPVSVPAGVTACRTMLFIPRQYLAFPQAFVRAGSGDPLAYQVWEGIRITVSSAVDRIVFDAYGSSALPRTVLDEAAAANYIDQATESTGNKSDFWEGNLWTAYLARGDAERDRWGALNRRPHLSVRPSDQLNPGWYVLVRQDESLFARHETWPNVRHTFAVSSIDSVETLAGLDGASFSAMQPPGIPPALATLGELWPVMLRVIIDIHVQWSAPVEVVVFKLASGNPRMLRQESLPVVILPKPWPEVVATLRTNGRGPTNSLAIN